MNKYIEKNVKLIFLTYDLNIQKKKDKYLILL